MAGYIYLENAREPFGTRYAYRYTPNIYIYIYIYIYFRGGHRLIFLI